MLQVFDEFVQLDIVLWVLKILSDIGPGFIPVYFMVQINPSIPGTVH
jgi:hypothetical protein